MGFTKNKSGLSKLKSEKQEPFCGEKFSILIKKIDCIWLTETIILGLRFQINGHELSSHFRDLDFVSETSYLVSRVSVGWSHNWDGTMVLCLVSYQKYLVLGPTFLNQPFFKYIFFPPKLL